MAKIHFSHHDIPSRSICAAFSSCLKRPARLILWIHILTTGNQSVTKTHSVLMQSPSLPAPPAQQSSEEDRKALQQLRHRGAEDTWDDLFKSFPRWLVLSAFHAEPVLNIHIQSHIQSSIDPVRYNAYEQPHICRHSNSHSCSLLSLHAKTGVTATHGEWVPNRLEKMRRVQTHTFSLSAILCVHPSTPTPFPPSILCLLVSLLQSKLMLLFTH